MAGCFILQVVQGMGQHLQRLFQQASGTGQIKAKEAFAAGAEPGAHIHADVGFVGDEMLNFLGGHTGAPEIHPDHVGAFGLAHLQLGQMLFQIG